MTKGLSDKKPLTKKAFERLLTKAAQPVSEWNKPVPVKKGTLAAHLSDGYSGKRKSQDKTEGKEG